MNPIRVPLPPAIYAVYVTAARFVRRDRGSTAPTAIVLIRHELSQRDPKLIADEYLAWLAATRKFRVRPGRNGTTHRVPAIRPAVRRFPRPGGS